MSYDRYDEWAWFEEQGNPLLNTKPCPVCMEKFKKSEHYQEDRMFHCPKCDKHEMRAPNAEFCVMCDAHMHIINRFTSFLSDDLFNLV